MTDQIRRNQVFLRRTLGTLGDDRLLSADELLGYARQWFQARRIVIGQANHPTVSTVWAELLELISSRQLRTVTLADVWGRTVAVRPAPVVPPELRADPRSARLAGTDRGAEECGWT